jgi:hypothetical protein
MGSSDQKTQTKRIESVRSAYIIFPRLFTPSPPSLRSPHLPLILSHPHQATPESFALALSYRFWRAHMPPSTLFHCFYFEEVCVCWKWLVRPAPLRSRFAVAFCVLLFPTHPPTISALLLVAHAPSVFEPRPFAPQAKGARSTTPLPPVRIPGSPPAIFPLCSPQSGGNGLCGVARCRSPLNLYRRRFPVFDACV